MNITTDDSEKKAVYHTHCYRMLLKYHFENVMSCSPLPLTVAGTTALEFGYEELSQSQTVALSVMSLCEERTAVSFVDKV